MKILKIILVISFFSFFACNTQNQKNTEITVDDYKQEILDMEKELFSHLEPDTSAAKEIIDKYVSFSNNYPNDSLSPEYLFKAAEIAMNFGEPKNAISYLQKIEKDYKDFNKYATSLFLIANIYNFYLNTPVKADAYYNKYIEKYPNHAFVEDAKAALLYLNMDEAEMIKKFQSMNEE
jgi:tetratricopeptide (TPR) repeat protein